MISLGIVFIPMHPKLMENGLINFTMAHKYELRLESCVGVVVAKDGKDFLLNWCVMAHAWEPDPEMDKALKEGSPFQKINGKVIPRFEFQ